MLLLRKFKLSEKKLSIAIVMLVFILLLITVELISYILNDEQLPFLYYSGEKNEIRSRIYSKLDPLLGYTFDRSVTPTEFELQHQLTLSENWKTSGSYLVFGENETNSNVRLLILGGSSTDSNLYNGNWPYYLHLKLKEKSISHVIYNGAVSGYSTNQEALKIYRDLPYIKEVDVVISYSGINDTIQHEDITPKHPWIHPYQLTSYNFITGRYQRLLNRTIMPNFVALVRSLVSKNTSIDLGFETESYEDRFKYNLNFMQTMTNKFDAKFFHFLQPLAWSIDQRDNNYKNYGIDESKNEIEIFYNTFRSKMPPFSHDLDELFIKRRKRCFIDFSHLNEACNKMVADYVYQVLSKKGILNNVN